MKNQHTDYPDDILSSLPDRLRVVEVGIAPEVQQAYLDFAGSIDSETYADLTLVDKGRKLLDPDPLPEKKKMYLILLAQEGTAEACLILDKFLKTAPQPLRDWGVLALETCWLLTEGDLFERETGMVISGLGGDGDRLRYFVAIPAAKGMTLTKAHQSSLADALARVSERFDVVAETLQLYQAHITAQLLIPMDVAVATVIEAIITKSNRDNRTLYPDHFVTNTNIPPEAEILDLMRRLRGD